MCFSAKWDPARRILGGSRTYGVSFWPLLNFLGWWWLVSSMFLTRTSCCKVTLANSYCGACLGWAISLSASSAAAESLQSCPTLCDPIDGGPPPGILQARTLEWVAISLSSAWKWKVKVKSLSHVRLFATPWTAAYQAPPSVGYSRQESWSGVALPSSKFINKAYKHNIFYKVYIHKILYTKFS